MEILLPNERIKPIEGFENYLITNKGRVWSKISNKWLKPTINIRGNYKREYVSLGRGNKFYIHQLVAKAFVDNPNNYNEIDHIDTNSLNNIAENLKWVSHKGNMENENTIENLKSNTGFLIEIEDIETGDTFWGREEVSNHYGVSICTVSKHLNGKVKNPRWRKTGNKKNPKEILDK